jgi:hypothetical protein
MRFQEFIARERARKRYWGQESPDGDADLEGAD